MWLDASDSPDSWDAWRRAALERALPLDVVLACSIEYCVIARVLATYTDQPAELLAGARHQAPSLVGLAPTPELRQWVAMLGGHAPVADDHDELPEIVIPGRVAVMMPRQVAIAELVDLNALDAAVACDRLAASHGVTLEGWALRSLLRGQGRY